MDIVTHLLLLSLCARSLSEPLSDALQRRSDGYGAYAGDYGQDYEPYVFAAVPLHAPLPVLRVLSPRPLTAPAPTKPHRNSASFQHPVYARPPYDVEYVTANSDYEIVYGEPHHSEEVHNYQASYAKPQFQPTALATEPEEAILYARPTAQGGYIYRKRPGSFRNQPKKTTSTPFIFRIHKYKIVKDDR